MQVPKKMALPGAENISQQLDKEPIIINSGYNKQQLTVLEALQIINDLSARILLHERCKES